MIHEYTLDLKKGEKIWIPLHDAAGLPYDAASIQTHNPQASTFDSGVITLKKANFTFGTPVVISTIGVTISSPGLTELALADYARAGYLVLDVTTAATSGTTVLNVGVCLKRYGFAVELDGGGA